MVNKTSDYNISSFAWFGVVYSLTHATFTALSDSYAVTKMKPSFVAMCILMEPAFTALISAFAESKFMTLVEVFGSILTTFGLAITLSGYSVMSGDKKVEATTEDTDAEADPLAISIGYSLPADDQTPLLDDQSARLPARFGGVDDGDGDEGGGGAEDSTGRRNK